MAFRDDYFSIVVTRGSLHHLTDHNRAMEEMYRVCKPGGKILITDIAVDKNKKEDFNNIKKTRVPSFTKALTLEDILEKMKALGAINIQSKKLIQKEIRNRVYRISCQT